MLVHDLRSPLGVVQGVLAMLEEADASEAALLDLGARAASELGQIVTALEALYACAGEPSRRDRVEVAALARGVVEGARCAASGRGKTMRVSARGDHWLVCDRQDLVRMLGNLVVNAVRHAEGEVEVVIDGDDGEVRVCVRDDGPGIAPALLGRLFDRFVRDRSAGRMGLGLAIVHRLADRYGGSVTAENRAERGEGRGACFVVRLPKRA
ncbi:MAG: HAMP domain-containing histidine kinase [Sandaracinaceae bacterium]|nr:HAMP domain-containing histidine kinase [Sandaracinaceae bacterium]